VNSSSFAMDNTAWLRVTKGEQISTWPNSCFSRDALSNILLKSYTKEFLVKVAILANLKEEAPVALEEPPGRWDDLDDLATIQAIRNSLQAYGFQAEYFPAGLNLVNDLAHYSPDFCFNMSEGHYGASREAQVPALLDMLQIPYTGSGVLGMSLAHNKHIAKNIFSMVGLPTAEYFVVNDPQNIPEFDIKYPLFVKPANEGSSIGINEFAIVNNYSQLVRQISWAYSVVKAPILVEKYIDGREFTIGIIGDELLPIVEVVSPTGYYSNALKESQDSGVYRVCPAHLPAETAKYICEIAVRAKNALKLEDLCRMDLRMDRQGNAYILEVNPLPLLYPDPEQASFVYASRVAGYTYAEMIYKIVLSALNRLKINEPTGSSIKTHHMVPSGMSF
jgi:D-alanine-D-alanine ligase